MTTALVLAGHGSHISPNTAGLVWEQVDRLRAMSVADEVTAAFWKEMPSFHTVLKTLTADDITVVPLFTTQGYFTQTVIPAEMGLTGIINQHGNRTIRYAKTLSETPYLSAVVRQRVVDGINELRSAPEDTAVAIIGHSTRRNPESRKATEAQAEQIRASGLVGEVKAVFLDDSPEIASIYELTHAPNLIAVPFFLASGSHTTIDVPRELGLEDRQSRGQINGRTIFYTSPVGIENHLSEVILELVREAGLVLNPNEDKRSFIPTKPTSWSCFPAAGIDELIQIVNDSGEIRFGQLSLSPHEVRSLGDSETSEVVDSPAALRARVRENPFRSLATTRNLPGGWRVAINHPQEIHAVVETVYPGTVADWAANRRKVFKMNTFEETTGRQTGNFRSLQTMNRTQQVGFVESVCGGCVRHPTWFYGESPTDVIPCPEPCNHWLSAALETIE